MPRLFEPDSDDMIIYDEEQEVPEMYFIIEGHVGVGFSLTYGINSKNHFVAKQLKSHPHGVFQPHMICDHYVVNNCKSQFIYMAQTRKLVCFALKKHFLHGKIFKRYPDIKEKLQEDCAANYRKVFFKQLNE